jgi:hypothetical protein
MAAVDTLLWLGRRDAAERYVRAFLAARPELRGDYRKELAGLEQNGFPPWHPTAYAEQLAYIAFVHGLRADY